MANSRPCKLGISLDSGGTSAPFILAVSTETIQIQTLQTEDDLKTWCIKNSRETGTTRKMKSYVMADFRLVGLSMGKFVFIIYKVSRLSESSCSMCNFNLYINYMLVLFSIQYSKTEGLASSLDCRSLVQGVHHTIVAVELWLQLMLRNLRLAKNFLNMVSYNIITFFNPMAERSPSCWLIGAAVSIEIR